MEIATFSQSSEHSFWVSSLPKLIVDFFRPWKKYFTAKVCWPWCSQKLTMCKQKNCQYLTGRKVWIVFTVTFWSVGKLIFRYPVHGIFNSLAFRLVNFLAAFHKLPADEQKTYFFYLFLIFGVPGCKRRRRDPNLGLPWSTVLYSSVQGN